MHFMHVRLNGNHIFGSPFRVMVGKQDADASLVKAYGDGLVRGRSGMWKELGRNILLLRRDGFDTETFTKSFRRNHIGDAISIFIASGAVLTTTWECKIEFYCIGGSIDFITYFPIFSYYYMVEKAILYWYYLHKA